MLPKVPDNMYYDREIIKSLKLSMVWWYMSWAYRSNWRVLHVDGFETRQRFPVSTGKKRIWFNYGELNVN